jgi:hypothetical protein
MILAEPSSKRLRGKKNKNMQISILTTFKNNKENTRPKKSKE